MKSVRAAIPALLPLLLLAFVSLVLWRLETAHHPGRRVSAQPSESFFTPPARANTLWYNGVALPRLDDLMTWQRATGEHPGIVQIYVPLGTSFPYGELQTIERRGAMPVVQIDYKQPVAGITSGRYDKILKAWGRGIRTMKEPVAVSFGHEMNGNWFPWGCTHTKPAVFISAWRRMHRLMASPNTRWVYTINRSNAGFRCGPLEYYPGNAFVNWIGIDGYLRHPADTYGSVFGPTIRTVRSATGKPVLLTEVGVLNSTSQARQLQALYASAYQSRSVIGIVYFDQTTIRGDYRPQDNPAALAMFRRAITEYGIHGTVR